MTRTLLTLLAANPIGASHIASDAITADKIAAGAVTSAKIDSDAVTSDKIGAGAIAASDIDLSDSFNFTGDLQKSGTAVADTSQIGASYYEVVTTRAASNLASLTGVSTSIGGATVGDNDEVLLTEQTTQSQNGIYVVSGTSGGTCNLTRSTSRNEASELPVGLQVYVTSGTYARRIWKLASVVTMVGSDAARFSEQSGLAAIGTSGEPVVVATGDGSTATFDLANSRVTQLAVFVNGVLQPPGNWSVSAGTGAAGVDQLVFGGGHTPANGEVIEVIGLYFT